MNDKSKLFFAFAIGAAVGAAVTALLTTDKGNELVDKAKSKTDELADTIKEKLADLEKEVVGIVDVMKEKPKV